MRLIQRSSRRLVGVQAACLRYQHIDALFGGEIDWDLIATHARDMFQMALSIQAGRVVPSMLLRKLGTYSRRNLLYRAFREPGRVERTLFLLRFVSSTEVRRTNVADMTDVLASMAEDKHPVTPRLVACLSPYTREHIRRFGQYVLDMNELPEPQPLPFEPAL